MPLRPIVSLLPIVLLLAAAPQAAVQPPVEASGHGVPLPPGGIVPPAFQPIQADVFRVAGSLSNAWGDMDNDGDLDFAVSLKSGEVRLYRNDAGTFVSVGAAMGLPTAAHELRGLSWGDYDGDGWLDLLGGATDPKQPTLVFHNRKGKGFDEVGAAIGLGFSGRSARQTSWVDYDNDGDVDVYAADRIGPNRLMRNDKGHFTQVFAGTGVSDPRPTVGACWFDYDTDGDLDLFLANQSGAADALWRNDGTGFVDVAATAGVAGPTRTKEEGGVGCAIGDYDNDGRLDLFVPNYGHNALYRNRGDGTFEDVSEASGVGFDNHGVGAAWGDYDNDGWLDLSIMAYEGPVGKQEPTNALLHNETDGKGGRHFVNILPRASAMNAGDHGVQWVDYDRDGALDLSITDGYGPVGGHFLFRNTLARDAAARSLSVLVLDARGHFTRPGAEVRLRGSDGRILATRQLATGDGYNTQSAQPVYFGLAASGKVTVEVTFLKNGKRVVQTYPGIRPNDFTGKSFVVRERAR